MPGSGRTENVRKAEAATLETTNHFRFGIVNETIRSLTFKLQRSRDEVYLVCRELTEFKHSWHSSGIHRFAATIGAPRPPMESTELPRLVEGRFWTVARVLLTAQSNWQHVRGAVGPKFLRLNPTPDNYLMVTLGFTSHHPQEHPNTASDDHLAVLKLQDDRYLTATLNDIPRNALRQQILEIYAPHRETGLLVRNRPIPTSPGYFDALIHFRTKLNTYFYWVHHDIPAEAVDSWPDANPIARSFDEAYALGRQGVNFGISGHDVVRELIPDWDEQHREIRSGRRRPRQNDES